MPMKNKCRKFMKVCYILPYVIAFSFSDILLNEPQDCQVSERLWHSIFGSVTAGEIQSLVPSMESIGAVFLFSLLFGNSISEFFGPGSSMFFTRLSDRKQWVWSKISGVYMFALAYTGLYLAVEVVIAMGSVTEPLLDRKLCLTVIELMMLLSLVFTATCLLANVVSIRYGTAIGIFGVFVLVIVLETVGIMLFDHKQNMILNPFCFHSGIVNAPFVACMKIAIDFFYALIISVGMVGYTDRMDIW